MINLNLDTELAPSLILSDLIKYLQDNFNRFEDEEIYTVNIFPSDWEDIDESSLWIQIYDSNKITVYTGCYKVN